MSNTMSNKKVNNESDILNKDMRAQIITEIIDGRENRERRFSELRKHEIYRDKNRKWIIQGLAEEGYRETTLFQMQNRATNISICKKVTNKLAQTYTGGVTRTVEDKRSQESIDSLTDELDFNTRMRKSDRYRQLFRNTMAQFVPVKSNDEPGKWNIITRILAPWQYDVIEDNHDLTKARVVVMSDFWEQHQLFQEPYNDYLRGSQGRRPASEGNVNFPSDRWDETIADTRGDKDMGEPQRKFIWWSDHYHFTTDENGEVIKDESPDDLKNPIGIMPFVNVTGDQDGFFWAIGGDDIVDGSLLINKLLTDINFITYTQGWGQLVISGTDIPKRLVGGPDNAFTFEVKEGDATPQVYYASSNPPISDWLETVKTTLALLLSTNDLSPRNISAKLDVSNAASGVALMIEMSESTADIKETQAQYQDYEPVMWEIIRRWHTLFSDKTLLVKDLQDIPKFTDSNVNLDFHEVTAAITEKERLENIAKRKEMGLNTMAELIQKDNPDLTTDEAKERAEEIMTEKKERQQQLMGDVMKGAMPNVGAVEKKPEPNIESDDNKDDDMKIESDKDALQGKKEKIKKA